MSDAVLEFFDGAKYEDTVFTCMGHTKTISVENKDYNEVQCFLVNGGFSFQSDKYGGNSGDAVYFKEEIPINDSEYISIDVTLGVGAINSCVTLHIDDTTFQFFTTDNHESSNRGGSPNTPADDNQYYSSVLAKLTKKNKIYFNLTEPTGKGWGGDATERGKGYGAGYSGPVHGGGGGGYIPPNLDSVSRLTSPSGFANLDPVTFFAPEVSEFGYRYIPGYIFLRFSKNPHIAYMRDHPNREDILTMRRNARIQERINLRKQARIEERKKTRDASS